MTQKKDQNWTDSAAIDFSRTPIIDTSAVRPRARGQRNDKPPGAGAGPESIAEQIAEFEDRFASLARRQKNHLFLISNLGGVRDDATNRDIIDTISSAVLVDYHPLGADNRDFGRSYADLAQVPPGMWIPCRPLRFTDTHEALVAARTIEIGDFEPMFCGFAPDIPLESRTLVATFITGKPRPGQAFIDALDRSLPVDNISVAHWSDAPDTWAVFCIPAVAVEIHNSGLGLDPSVYYPKRPGKSAS